MTKKKTPTADDFLPADWFFKQAAGVQIVRAAEPISGATAAEDQPDQGKAVEQKGRKDR